MIYFIFKTGSFSVTMPTANEQSAMSISLAQIQEKSKITYKWMVIKSQLVPMKILYY